MSPHFPSIPTINKTKYVNSFAKMKEVSAAQKVVDTVLAHQGDATKLAASDNQPLDEFHSVGLVGRYTSQLNELEMVRFNTSNGEVTEFGYTDLDGNSVSFETEEKKLGPRYIFTTEKNEKQTRVVVDSGGYLINLSNEWVG
jgi:hypothetical protein